MMRSGVVLRATLFASVALTTAGLSSCYIVSQGRHLLGHQLRAKPVESIEGHTEFFRTVRSIRAYGRDELGLADTENYTRFVEIDGDHLVTVVSATEETSFAWKEWWFPFFGRFPYKGFYREKSARRLARRLDGNGYDVFVRRVDAFSTLGYFRDPLYSFMTDYDPFRLASLIIHEQTHATLFLKNEVQFNEELATFVGYHGALSYLESVYGRDSQEYFDASVYWEELDVFLAEIRGLHARLATLYRTAEGADGPENATRRSDMLKRKAEIIETFQSEFAGRYDALFATDRFRWFADYPVNNAVIDVYMKYTRDLSLFESLYDAVDRSIPRLLAYLAPLEGSGQDPKSFMRTIILDEADQS